MSIKLTWKDNTTIENRYEVWKINPTTGDKTLEATLPGTESKGEYTWVGAGEYECGDHTFNVAAISPTEQYAWLDDDITITLPCDENIVICQRFETNLGNSAPAAVEIDAVYNLTTYTNGVVPSIKTDLASSLYFRGDSAIEYKNTGVNMQRLYFAPLPPENNKDFTVEGWFRFEDFTNELNENGSIIFSGSLAAEAFPNPSIEGGVYHTPNDANGNKVAKIFFKARSGTGMGNMQEYITDAVIEPLVWTHIAWVKKSDKLHIYVNGELYKTFNFIGLNIAPTGTWNGMRLGTGTAAYVNANPGMGYRGHMVDFRIINGQAITICPDMFPLSLCEPGTPVDEDKKVQNEYVSLNACTGINTTNGSWLDGSGENPFTFSGGNFGISVHDDPEDCPCYAEINTVLKGPSTSTFQKINTFSFASWFKSDTTIQPGSNERSLLDYTHKVGNAKYGFKLVLSSNEGGKTGTLDLVVGTGLGGDWVTYKSFKDTWMKDKWYHVIVIHHGAMITMYINDNFHRGIANVTSINSHSEDVTIGVGWNGSLNLSTWDFYKNKILNSQEIERSYDPEVVIPTTNPCPGSSPCTIDRVYTDFSDWGDFHGTWSKWSSWTLISQHDSTHPGWNNSKLDGTGNPVNPHVKINTDNSITFDPEFHYGSTHNRVYAFSPELHNINSGAEGWCISASIEGTAGGEIAIQPMILQDGKIYMVGNLGSSGLKSGGNAITDLYVSQIHEVTNVVFETGNGPPNLRKPFQIGIGMSNSILNTFGTLTKYEVCIKSFGKKCLPPKTETIDPSCDDLKLHLSYDHIDTDLDVISDSSKYNRFIPKNSSTHTSINNFYGQTKQLYTLDDVSVDVNDDFRVAATDKMCVDGWLKVPGSASAYYLVKKIENNWSKTALTPLVYNGHDWYIYVDPSSKYLELAHGEQRQRIDIETDKWFHFACVLDQGFKSMYIDGDEPAVEVFDNIAAQTPNPSMIMNGLVDDLRIVKGDALYNDQFWPPVEYTSTACRDETPDTTCVRVTNDEVFNTWSVQNNKSHDAVSVIEKYNREAAIIKTVSGAVNYVGLVREDVVVFDYPLADATELRLDLTHRKLRLDVGTSSDVYFVIKQNNTWFYYYMGTTSDSSIETSKSFTIDVVDSAHTWTPTYKSGNDALDLSGGTETNLGFAISNTDAGNGKLEVTNASIEIAGKRCDKIVTPDQPLCSDVVLHLQSKDKPNNHNTIQDHSSNQLKITKGNVQHSTSTSKYGTSSLEFNPLSGGLKAETGSLINFSNTPFTIEFWANLNSINNVQHFYSQSSGTDGSLFRSYIKDNTITVDINNDSVDILTNHTSVGEWHHYAIAGDGSNMSVFIDGELQHTSTYQADDFTGDFYTGAYTTDEQIHPLSGLDGHVDDFRVTVGTAVYSTKFLPPLKLPVYLSEYTLPADCTTTVLHVQSHNFPTGSELIVDSSGRLNQLVVNSTTHDESQLFDSNSSLKFTSASNVEVVGSTQTIFNVLSGEDFTIESWIKPTLTGQKLTLGNGDRGYGVITNMSTVTDTGHMLFITGDGSLGYKSNSSDGDIHVSSDSGIVPVNEWSHVAVTRSDSIISVYLNGKSVTGGYYSSSITSVRPMVIANAITTSLAGGFIGYMNDIRYIIGHSVYNGCGTTIPTSLITKCSNIVNPIQPECDDVAGHIQIGALDITDDVVDLSKHSHEITSTSNQFLINQSGGEWYVQTGSEPNAGQIISPIVHTSDNLGDSFTIETFFMENFNGGVDYTYLIYNPGFNLRINSQKIVFEANGTELEYIHTGNISSMTRTHVAVCRSGKGVDQTKIYVDGIPVATGTFTDDVKIENISGNPGYMIGGTPTTQNPRTGSVQNDIRVSVDHSTYMGEFLKLASLPTLRVNVTEPVINNIKLFLQTEGNNGATNFTDISRSNHTVVNDGDRVVHTTDDKKWGDSSVKFDSQINSVLMLPRINNVTSDFIDIRFEDFTYELWIKVKSIDVSQTLLSLDKKQSLDTNASAYGHDAIKIDITSTNAIRCQLRSRGAGNPFVNDGTSSGVGVIQTRDDVIKLDTWHHVAWSRHSGVFKVYIDGANVSTPQSDTSTGSANSWPWEPMTKDSEGNELSLVIGGTRHDQPFNGYIDGFRYIKGQALYTECSYIVPTDKSPLDKTVPVIPDCELVLSHIQTDLLYGVSDFSGKENTLVLKNTDQTDTQLLLNGPGSIPLSGAGVNPPSSTSVTVTNVEDPQLLDTFGPVIFHEMWIKPPTTKPDTKINTTDRHFLRIFTMKDVADRDTLKVLVSDTQVSVYYGYLKTGSMNYIGPFKYDILSDWFHLAIKRVNDKYTAYINGEFVGSATNTLGTNPHTSHYVLGDDILDKEGAIAYIDDVRISKEAIFPSSSTIYAQRLLRCDSSPGTCVEFSEGSKTLKLCMSFESNETNDMSRYAHEVTTVSGNSGVVVDNDHQSYLDGDNEKKYYHAGYHGTMYHDINLSNGINVTSSDHLNIMDQEFAVEIHIPATFTQNVNLTDNQSYWTLYHHDGDTGDRLTLAFKPISGTIALVAELVSGTNNLQLVANAPVYDFTETTRGDALQRVMISRQQGIVNLYGYYNTDEGQGSVLASDSFIHPLNLNNDIKIGHGNPVDPTRNGRWYSMIDSIRVAVGGIIGNCSYIEKKQCIKCEGFTGDEDAVKYICAVARSIGVQPVEIEYDKLYEINKFIVTGKAEGWWSKTYALYLPIWQDPLANAINAKSPGDYNLNETWVFNQDSGEWKHDNGPYTQLTNYNEADNGNGITTPFSNFEFPWTADSCSFGIYLKDTPLDHDKLIMEASTTHNNGISVNTTSRCHHSDGFTLKTSQSAVVNTYNNGTIINTDPGNLPVIGVDNEWVVGGVNWGGTGSMSTGVNNLKVQGIYFGDGIDHQESKSLSSSLVKLVQTFDHTDKHPSDVIHEDHETNKALFAILYRQGYTYTNPSWIRERNAMPGLTPASITHHQLYQSLVNYYSTGKTDMWLDRIKALYLPMWRDSNVNRINFACPWLHDIENWNSRLPFWRLGGGSLVNPPVVGGTPILPTPYAAYSADSLTLNDQEYITTWTEQSGNGRDLIYDNSNHDDLTTEPTGPQFLSTGGLNRDEKCILFGYNGSRTPGQEHLYEPGRVGNAYKLIGNSGIPVSPSTYKHIFIVYRNITAVPGSTPLSLTTDTSIFTQYNSTEGESITQSGFGSATINGYRGSYWKENPTGALTWTPDPKTIWPDGSNTTTAGTPLLGESRFGKRVIHYQPNTGDNTPLEVVFCLGDSSENNPVAIHGEYYDVVVYDQDLTGEQITAVYNYLGSKHNISLHDDLLHNDYSASVEHGHGSYAYIPSNNGIDGDITTQGTLTDFEYVDNTHAYQNKFLALTENSGGFGSIKYARDYCGSKADLEVSMGNDTQQGWALGTHTNNFNTIDAELGVLPGFSYISREANTNDLYTIDLTVPSDSYTRTANSIPVKSPALFALNDDGATHLGSQDKYQSFFYTDNLTLSGHLSSFGETLNTITDSVADSPSVTCNVNYVTDPDAQSYICAVVNAGGLLSSEAANDLRVGAVNDFIVRGKAQGWWSKIKALYLPIWQCTEANKINMVTPGIKSLILDNSKLDHESGKYLRMLGNGSGDELSNEIIIPYKPKDIYRSTCEDHDPRDPSKYTHNITTYFRNFNTKTGSNPLMWSFMLDSLDNTGSVKTYENDSYNPDVDRDDLLMLEWPGRGSSFSSGPVNVDFSGAMVVLPHDKKISGGLLSENIIGDSHSDLTFGDINARSSTATGLKNLKDTGGTGHRDYVIPQYYLNAPMGGSENTCVSYIALGAGFNVDSELVMFDDYKSAVKDLVSFADSKLNAHAYATIGSEVVKLHGIKSGGIRGSTVTLASVKKSTSAYNIPVSETPTTTSTPLTSIWEDVRSWNYKLHNYNIELIDPDYDGPTSAKYVRPYGHSTSHTDGGDNSTGLAFGYALRRPQGGLGFSETNKSSSYNGSGNFSNPEAQTFIRGLTSGAVRRSTYAPAGSKLLSNPAGPAEDRMLKFKILPDAPHKGVFVGGGSFRTADTTATNSTDGAIHDSSRFIFDPQDLFNKYPSNNTPFIVGENLDIMYITGSFHIPEHGEYSTTGASDAASILEQTGNTVASFPIQSNIERYNGKYRVAELTDLNNNLLTDGEVFTNSTTSGGPEPRSVPGEAKPTKAWMRIEMNDITTIDVGATNLYDLVLTSALSATDATNQHEWTSRFYFHDSALLGDPNFKYTLDVDSNSNIYVGGTYSNYAVVNYDIESEEKYGMLLNSTGEETSTISPNPSGFTQAFTMKVNPDNGQVVAFRTTQGDGNSSCLGTACDSVGNIYMVGSVAGDVDFTDNHGKFRSLSRGVNTTSVTNKYGFIAKSSMDHTLLDKHNIYRPLDYTWEWVNYVDYPGVYENQTRVVSDIAIDSTDNIYVIGYFDCPSEIGRTASASRLSDTLLFEPGYHSTNNSDEVVFVSKYNTDGKCMWTNTSMIDSLNNKTQKIMIHNDSVYVMNNANGVNFGGMPLSGVCIDAFELDSGVHTISRNLNTTSSIKGNDFNVSDNDIISVVGDFTGDIKSDTTTLISKPNQQSNNKTTGFFGLLPIHMQTGRVGSFKTPGENTTCGGTSMDYSIGHNTIMGVSTGSPSIKLGPVEVNISKPVNHQTYTFTLSHEL